MWKYHLVAKEISIVANGHVMQLEQKQNANTQTEKIYKCALFSNSRPLFNSINREFIIGLNE